MGRRAPRKTGKGKSRWTTSGILLCVVVASLWAAKKPKNSDPEITQKRALHALDRLTFGPRPGDVQSVATTGVDKWIEQQLHPEKIDDSAMQARLSGYRTVQMSSREMLLNFPPDPIIKAMQAGKVPMPQDPYRRAIYFAAIDRMQQRQEQKQNVPAVIRYYREFYPESNDEGVIAFFLAAAAIGGLCKRNASLSGAEVGCQGEVGVACSMAAGGLAAALAATRRSRMPPRSAKGRWAGQHGESDR